MTRPSCASRSCRAARTRGGAGIVNSSGRADAAEGVASTPRSGCADAAEWTRFDAWRRYLKHRRRWAQLAYVRDAVKRRDATPDDLRRAAETVRALSRDISRA